MCHCKECVRKERRRPFLRARFHIYPPTKLQGGGGCSGNSNRGRGTERRLRKGIPPKNRRHCLVRKAEEKGVLYIYIYIYIYIVKYVFIFLQCVHMYNSQTLVLSLSLSLSRARALSLSHTSPPPIFIVTCEILEWCMPPNLKVEVAIGRAGARKL